MNPFTTKMTILTFALLVAFLSYVMADTGSFMSEEVRIRFSLLVTLSVPADAACLYVI